MGRSGPFRSCSVPKLDPGRGVIAGFGERSDRTIDSGLPEPVGGITVKQQMVDPEPGVTGVGVSKIVPEGEDDFVRVAGADRVGPTLAEEAFEGFAHIAHKQRILRPALGFVDVERGWDDVAVACQDRRAGEAGQLGSERLERRNPAQLVVELRPGSRIAVGEIEAADQNASDRGLKITALTGIGIVGKATPGFDGLRSAREKGDPVLAFLPVSDGAVTGAFD